MHSEESQRMHTHRFNKSTTDKINSFTRKKKHDSECL